jgi:CubicO group peptidase (beta-lactamase class C family)
MKRMIGIGLTILAPLSVGVARAQQAELPADVRDAIETRVTHGYNAGMIVGIIGPEGVRYRAFGHMRLPDGPAPDERTVFEIGSITKVFTALLLADMAGTGEVRLSDAIGEYLPEEVEPPERNGRRITLLDLATHTSALPRVPGNMLPVDPANPYARYTPQLLYAFLSVYQPSRDVGSSYEYSNLGYGLLGHVLARRAGTDYGQLVVERIAEPLGLEDTRAEPTDSMRDRLARGYSGGIEVPPWDVPDPFAGAGALLSTAADMSRFVAANMGLIDLLLRSPADSTRRSAMDSTLRSAMDSTLRSAMDATQRPRVPTDSPNMSVGLGWHISEGEGGTVIWHNGGTGGYRSFIGFTADKTTGVVVLSNSNESVDDIGFHLLDPSRPLREVRIPVEVSEATLQRYVGRYELRPGFVIQIRLRDGLLTAQASGQPELRLFPTSSTRFFLAVVDAEIEFPADGGEEVSELILHQNGEQRARRIE